MTAAELNVELLSSWRSSEADLEHIAEEIEDMGKREQRSLHNRLVRLTLPAAVTEAYADSAGVVLSVTKRPRLDLHGECPYTVGQLLGDSYLP